MALQETFVWHPRAHLFAGTQEIARPKHAGKAFRSIPAHPTATALTSLVAALAGKSGFCVHQSDPLLRLDCPEDRFLALTGGTSGAPKIIQRKQSSWTASFAQNAQLFDYTSNDAIAVFGALSHSLALYGVIEALHLGLSAHALDMLRPTAQRSQIAERQITILYLTPSQLSLLSSSRSAQPLPSVRLILCGGGALSLATRAAAQALCPKAQIRVFYGAAETSFITISDDRTPAGSVGRPFPGVELTLGEEGEVWVKSPYLFEAYVSGSASDTVWRDRYLSVGELGRLDAAGNLTLRGRKTRMVTVADQNVFPEEVEAFIAKQLPDHDCAVVTLPDPRRGSRLIAILEGSEDSSIAANLRRAATAALGALAAPKSILFHPTFPRLPSGKPDLIALTQWAEETQ